MWYLTLVLLVGVVSLLYGIARTLFSADFKYGIWFGGVGVVLVVLVLLLCAGWNNTAYYPSNTDLQSSLTIANSSGSVFTLTAMSVVSLLIPFVFGLYICCLACHRPQVYYRTRDNRRRKLLNTYGLTGL